MVALPWGFAWTDRQADQMSWNRMEGGAPTNLRSLTTKPKLSGVAREMRHVIDMSSCYVVQLRLPNAHPQSFVDAFKAAEMQLRRRSKN
jgi:hypothetical protein